MFVRCSRLVLFFVTSSMVLPPPTAAHPRTDMFRRGAGSHAVGSQCPSAGQASPVGPPVSAADSGRLYSHVVSADGQEFYYFKRVGPGAEDYRIFRSLRTETGWSTPEPLSLGGDHSDLYPTLSADGSRLVFSSYRPAPGDTATQRNAHIWMAQRLGTGWAQPELVRASMLGHYHSGLMQDSTGTLRFRLTTPDWRTQRDAELRWQRFGFDSTISFTPVLPAVEYWRRRSGDTLYVWGAVMARDGAALLQVSRVTPPDRRRAPAQYFVTYAHGTEWTPPVPARGGMGEGSPGFAWISRDGCFVHYTRDYSQFMRVPAGTVFVRPPQNP